jgi:hypothetical protein
MSTASGSSATDASADAIARRFEALPALLAGDAVLARRGRFMTCDFKLGVGDIPLVVGVAEGRVRGPFLLRPWVFGLTAPAGIWSRFLEAIPEAGYHDIMALSKTRQLAIEGNLQPLMANLQFVKDVVAAPRTRPAGG